jgi:hypothetical protein
MKLTFDPGTEQITSEWLQEHADRIDKFVSPAGDFSWAVFEVEPDDGDGFLEVRVSMRFDMREAAAIEIDTGWRTEEGMQSNCVGIGLYDKLADLTALLELLARGNHF